MAEKKTFQQLVEEICEKDSRYHPDAYEFVMCTLHFTQESLKRKGHINGRELLRGIREFAIDQYGSFAKAVLNHWGINLTEDFGNIVFNMVENRLLSKTEEDSPADFKDIYTFDAVFSNALQKSVIKELKKGHTPPLMF